MNYALKLSYVVLTFLFFFLDFVEEYFWSSAVDGKRFLEPYDSSIRGTYFRLG